MALVHSSYQTGTSHDTAHTPRRDNRPLEDLFRRRQWTAWKLERRPGDKPDAKPTKVPYTPGTGCRDKASSTDPATWGTCADARADVIAGHADGIGFVFSADDPYFGIDLDGCRDPETGQLEPWAAEIVERFSTYTEPSPSGTGVHIIGRGVKPADGSRKGRHIECYDRERYFTMTLEPIAGYTRIRDCGDVLTAWHREVWPPAAESTGTAAPVTLTLEDRDILDLLQRESTGKGAALVRGDVSGYVSHSEARYALAQKAAFYTDDASQIARILLSSGLFKAGMSDREKARKAERDAGKATAEYSGPRYSPGGPGNLIIRPRVVATPPADLDNLTVDQLRARLASAEAELHAHRQLLEGITTILACDQIEAGPRVTAIGVLLEGTSKRARGEEPTPDGYYMPAAWIAKRTGQTPKTVSGHLKKLSDKAQVIDRTVKREKIRITDEWVDADGVIERETRDANGQKGYIAFPENVIDFADRIARYRRDEEAEDAKHGGTRVACQDHPDAGTYTQRITRCKQCHEIVHREGIPAPIESVPKMGSDSPTVVIDLPKMGSDSEPDTLASQVQRGFTSPLSGDRQRVSVPKMGSDCELADPDPLPAGPTCGAIGCNAPVERDGQRCLEHTWLQMEVSA